MILKPVVPVRVAAQDHRLIVKTRSHRDWADGSPDDPRRMEHRVNFRRQAPGESRRQESGQEGRFAASLSQSHSDLTEGCPQGK